MQRGTCDASRSRHMHDMRRSNVAITTLLFERAVFRVQQLLLACHEVPRLHDLGVGLRFDRLQQQQQQQPSRNNQVQKLCAGTPCDSQVQSALQQCLTCQAHTEQHCLMDPSAVLSPTEQEAQAPH